MPGGIKIQVQIDPPKETDDDPGSPVESLAESVSVETFETWHLEREYARHIREGTSYFNGPSASKLPQRHSPSSLLQCGQKGTYKKSNAPEEPPDPADQNTFIKNDE